MTWSVSLLCRQVAFFLMFVCGLAVPTTASCEEQQPVPPEGESSEESPDSRKERFTTWMRDYAESTQILAIPANDDFQPELVPYPLMRYSDEERAIPDATLWVWTQDARPVALQKVEGNNHRGAQLWTICFASLSESPIGVRWSNARRYEARKPGIHFQPIPQADAPSDKARGRVSQIRSLKERFTGRIGADENGENGAESRIIVKPLYEYADPETNLPIGALFGMSSTGTNPDMLLLIEARPGEDNQPRWEYAYGRMTSASVLLRLDDTTVWWDKGLASDPAGFDNWIYYFLAREFK